MRRRPSRLTSRKIRLTIRRPKTLLTQIRPRLTRHIPSIIVRVVDCFNKAIAAGWQVADLVRVDGVDAVSGVGGAGVVLDLRGVEAVWAECGVVVGNGGEEAGAG